MQPDGKIVVVGVAEASTGVDLESRDFALARYNPDGILDVSFGDGGKVTTDVFGDDSFGGDDSIFGLTLQPDGKIVAVGPAKRLGRDYDFVVTRYNSDGTLDLGFGTTGRVRTEARYFVLARYQIG